MPISEVLPGVWAIDGDTHHRPWIISAGKLAHDEATLPAIRKYIPQGGVVVDGGAHVGSHTGFYLDCVGPEGIVISFEPNPPAYRCLVRNCPDAVTYQLALGSRYDLSQIAHDDNYGGAYLTEYSPVRGSTVVSVPLDEFGLEQVDFLKLDVEGSEVEALFGAYDTIKLCKPTMLIEVNDGALQRRGVKPIDLYAEIESLGYRYEYLFPSHHMNMPQTDVICFPL